MDVGIFKASRARLVGWTVVPPLLIVGVGLSSFAMQQRAEWQLKETKALSNVLPEVIQARKDVRALFDSLGLSGARRITSGDQLIALLEEKARNRNIDLKKTQIQQRDNKAKKSNIPTISAIVEASGDFSDFQHFLNDVKSVQPLVAVGSIGLNQRSEDGVGDFELKVVFDLMLVDEVLKASGGSQ